MRKLVLAVLAAVGLTTALLTGPAWAAPVNGINLANAAMNGTNPTGSIDTTGLSLRGVILPPQ
jgi:hypothetical protein